MSPSPEPWNPERAVEIVASGADMEGALLPILHALQAAFGCVPDAAVLARTVRRPRTTFVTTAIVLTAADAASGSLDCRLYHRR